MSRARNDEGAIFPFVLVGVLIMGMISAAVVGIADRSMKNAAYEEGRNQTRLMAQASADLFFARLASNPEIVFNVGDPTDPDILNTGVLNTAASDLLYRGTVSSYDAPAGLPDGQEFRSDGWLRVDGTDITPCADLISTCVQYHLRVAPASETVPTRTAALVVTARQACSSTAADDNPPSLASCETAAVTLRLRERQAFAFMFFDERQTLDPLLYASEGERQLAVQDCTVTLSGRNPVNCEEVPYYGGDNTRDVITGPVHTNDEAVLTCNDPQFIDAGTVSSGGPHPAGDDALVPIHEIRTLPPGVCDRAAAVVTGTRTDLPPTIYPMPVDTSALAQVANPADQHAAGVGIDLTDPDPDNPDRGEYSVVTYDADGNETGRDTRSRPGTGVIYVEGDVSVQGTGVCYPVSVASAGSVRIVGNVTHSTDTTNCPNAMIGLMATNAVGVVPALETDPGDGREYIDLARTPTVVQAAVVALGRDAAITDELPLGGSFFLGDPTGATDDTTRRRTFYDAVFHRPGENPTLTFTGAVYQRFRGAFGTFDQDNDAAGIRGVLLTGMAKDFRFDERFRSQQPPYLISPTRTAWIRESQTDSGAVSSPR